MSGVEIALSALLSVTNVPGYYACYTEAVTGTVEVQRRVLAMPSNECVRGNSTYVNTERFLLGIDVGGTDIKFAVSRRGRLVHFEGVEVCGGKGGRGGCIAPASASFRDRCGLRTP